MEEEGSPSGMGGAIARERERTLGIGVDLLGNGQWKVLSPTFKAAHRSNSILRRPVEESSSKNKVDIATNHQAL